ncbi:hypothetical protein CALVIDRAFT_566454 [Calocera viscosa TUFC12733]|uniref:Uncharacterized protein n=1 Tax=Calocera viscosa (strain TUFC12733) TaxID=1330018 RepID=A0A167JC93_CALVF|nr:hypothetical protein CALVIDRAFT_566454 [Calocera viscosa TUFC12733]
MAVAGPSNSAILGHSRSVWEAKKRQKKEQVQEVVFDDTARHDFLTGFHKRKLAKHQDKVARAKEREHLQRLQDRADKRKLLREKAVENAKQVEAVLGGEAAAMLEDAPEPGGKEEEEEYSGDEQFATVTLIEDFDPSADLYPPTHPPADPADAADETPKPPRKPPLKPASSKVKAVAGKEDKERKCRYESKAGRKTAKTKERSRRREKAGTSGTSVNDKAGRKGKAKRR